MNVNSIMNYANFLGSSTKTPMLHLKCYDQWVDQMEDYLTGIDKELWRPIKSGPCRVDHVQAVVTATQGEDMTMDRLKQEGNDKMCIRELHGALPPIFYNYIRG